MLSLCGFEWHVEHVSNFTALVMSPDVWHFSHATCACIPTSGKRVRSCVTVLVFHDVVVWHCVHVVGNDDSCGVMWHDEQLSNASPRNCWLDLWHCSHLTC